jgi:hypothetical protein
MFKVAKLIIFGHMTASGTRILEDDIQDGRHHGLISFAAKLIHRNGMAK